MIKINSKKYFLLFASCIPVKGAYRSIICDTQRNSFIYITNEIYDIFSSSTPVNYNLIKTISDDDLQFLLEDLINNEYGFYTDDYKLFPKINLQGNDYPQNLKSIIIDFDKDSKHNLIDIGKQISELLCQNLELRFYSKISNETLKEYLGIFEPSTLRSINLVLPYTEELTKENIDKICVYFKRVKQIIIHGSPESKTINLDLETIVLYVKEDILNNTHCGNVSPYYFRCNLEVFRESIAFNNCLNLKIGIDTCGNIKNCPSLDEVLGNISSDKIADILHKKELQKYELINKDKIEVCKDCEFRYICIDCRAYRCEDNITSKPKKCSYNPYRAVWL